MEVRSLFALLSSSAIALVVASPAAAQPTQADPGPPVTMPVDKPKDTAKRPLEWKYQRVTALEYGATGALLLGFVAADRLMKDDAPNWRGGVLFDSAAMGVGRGDSSSARDRAARVSDYLLFGMFAWPFLDVGVATARGSADAGWQMAVINTEAFALNGLITTVIKRTVRRERPWVAAQCNTPEGQADPSCRDSQSFLSGHASTAFTSAGLVCAHHGALPLYGNKIADGAACVTALAAATATGSLRVVADKHYATDVAAGAALGLLSGYLLPKVLHYGFGSSSTPSTDEAKKKKHPTVAWSAAPMATPGGAMLSVSGVIW